MTSTFPARVTRISVRLRRGDPRRMVKVMDWPFQRRCSTPSSGPSDDFWAKQENRTEHSLKTGKGHHKRNNEKSKGVSLIAGYVP